MKETPAGFERRTGERYAPTPWLRLLGGALAPRETCPTLFRFPGVEGLHAHFRGQLRRLGPAERRRHVWLTSRPTGAYPRPVGLFGTLAVLQPLRLQACRTHCFTHTRDNWVALDRLVPEGEIVWVPPSRVRSCPALDRVRDADGARRRFGPHYGEELERTADAVSAYLEELSELRRRGAQGPARHWCAVPARERRELLAQHAVTPRWTRP